MHRENEYNSHLQPLLLIYAHACEIHRNTSAAPLDSPGGLSPNISSYIQSLWYPSGAEPGLALGTGKGTHSLELQIAGEQQTPPAK